MITFYVLIYLVLPNY